MFGGNGGEGEGKKALRNLVELATTGLISFTSGPLRIVTILGIVTLVFGFAFSTEARIG